MNKRNHFKSGFLRAALMLTLAVMTFPTKAWAQGEITGLTYNSEGYYEIPDAAALNSLSTYVNNGNDCSGKTFKLTADITYTHDDGGNENNFTAIGSSVKIFYGIFDGQNHVISGIRIYRSDNNGDAYLGLFGYIGPGGEVKSVMLADTEITGYSYVGGIVGYNEGTISGCTSIASITSCDLGAADYCFGGIVGYNEGTVKNCLYLGNKVSGGSFVGAIVGLNNDGKISNCYFTDNTLEGIGPFAPMYKEAYSEYPEESPNPAVGAVMGTIVNTGLAHIITLGEGFALSGTAIEYGRITAYAPAADQDGFALKYVTTSGTTTTTTYYSTQDATVTFGYSTPTDKTLTGYLVTKDGSNSKTVNVTKSGNTCSFKMPASDVTVNTIIPSVAIDIDAPVPQSPLDEQATCTTTGVASNIVTWKNGDNSVSGNAEAGSTYEVTVWLTSADGYIFTTDTKATMNGNEVSRTVTADGRTLTVSYIFPATYTLSLAESAGDASDWSISPTGSLAAETKVTINYTGSKPEGYNIGGYIVKDADGGDVNVTETDGVFSFNMSAKNVTIYGVKYYMTNVPYIGWDDTNKTYITDAKTPDGTKVWVLTGGGATTLPGGWYVVNNHTEGVDAAYTGQLKFTGDVHLILCDDAELTVMNSITPTNMTIYGQASQTGKLTVITDGIGNSCINLSRGNFIVNGGIISATATGTDTYGIFCQEGNFTINNGQVTANGSRNGLLASGVTINGGKVSAEGQIGIYIDAAFIINDGEVTANGSTDGIHAYEVTIKGGKVTANGSGTEDNGIFSSGAVTIIGGQITATNTNGYGIQSFQSDITLRWTNATDFIQASSYKVDATYEDHKVKTAEGKAFEYEGGMLPGGTTLTDSQIEAIAGKKLTPPIVATVTTTAGTEFFGVDATNTTNAAAFQAAVNYAQSCYKVAQGDTPATVATVTLNKDVSFGSDNDLLMLTIGNGSTATAVKLDLNSKTLSSTMENICVVFVKAYAELTIIGNGTISNTRKLGYAINNNGTLNVSGGNIYGTQTSISNSGMLTISDGTICATGKEGYGIENIGTVTITGGTISGNGYGIYNYGTLTLHKLDVFGDSGADIWLNTNNKIGFGSGTYTTPVNKKIKVVSSVDNALPYTFTSGYGIYVKSGDDIIAPANVFDYSIEGSPYSASFRLVDANDSKEVQAYLPLYAYIDENGKLHDDLDGSTETTDDDGHAATVLTGGDATTLPGGWYVVNNHTEGVDAAYTGQLQFTGDAHIILCDGAAMTVGTKDRPISDDALLGYNNSGTANINIYGQSTDAATMGSLTACGTKIGIYSFNSSVTINGGRVIVTGKDQDGICADYGLTINGGWVDATGGSYGISSPHDPVIINGGKVEATGGSHGIFAMNAEVTINGGQVTATGGTNGSGINAGNDITLGWTNATDFIQASSYCVFGDHSVKIPAGKYLYFTDVYDNTPITGVLGEADTDYIFGAEGHSTLDDIANKKLIPALPIDASQSYFMRTFDGNWKPIGGGKTFLPDGYDLAKGVVTLKEVAGAPNGQPVIFGPEDEQHPSAQYFVVGASGDEAKTIQDEYDNVVKDMSERFVVTDGTKTLAEILEGITDVDASEAVVLMLVNGKFTTVDVSADDLGKKTKAGLLLFVLSKWEYMHIKPSNSNTTTNAATRTIAIGDGETTSLTPNPSPKGEGSDWYDLQGRKISKPTKKGIYIFKNKKVKI